MLQAERGLSPEQSSEQKHFYNLSAEELVDHAEKKGQGFRINYLDEQGNLQEGALSTVSRINKRSPKDKYYVTSPKTEGKVWEEVNHPLSAGDFETLLSDVVDYQSDKELYIQDVALGVPPLQSEDPDHRTRRTFRFISTSPAHALFAKTLYRELTPEEMHQTKQEDYSADVTVHLAPDFQPNYMDHGTSGQAAIVFDYENGRGIIAGSDYFGEIKKFGFTWMHEVADTLSAQNKEKDALFVIKHGSLMQKKDGRSVIIKGGSGAGKSSALKDLTEEEIANGKIKVGDDEILIKSVNGVTTAENLEGGFYLTSSNWDNERRFKKAGMLSGSLLENVVIDPKTKMPVFSDVSLTPNARGAISAEKLTDYKESGITGGPSDEISLVPDPNGIYPPVAKLEGIYQAMLWDLIGPGAEVPGRAAGAKAMMVEKFTPLQDAPFLYRQPIDAVSGFTEIYRQNNTQVWLVSSGYRRGTVETGIRPPVEYTQLAVDAIVEDKLENAKWTKDPIFGFLVLHEQEGVDPRLTEEDNAWENPREKEAKRIEYAKKVRAFFYENYPRGCHPLWYILESKLPQVPDQHAISIPIYSAAAHLRV